MSVRVARAALATKTTTATADDPTSINADKQGIVGGCTFDFSFISYGQAFVLEFGCYFAVAFLAFGVGLDPRQGQIFGPAYSPVLVGAVVALCSFGTGYVRPGWSGACESEMSETN
jgi:hypothetical protein